MAACYGAGKTSAMDAIPVMWYKTPMDVAVSGQAVHRVRRQPGFSTGWRTLPWLTVQAVISGTYRLDHAAGSERLPAGSVWFIPIGCRHCHAVEGDGVVETTWWHGDVRLHGAIDAFAACGAPRIWQDGWSGRLGTALRALREGTAATDLAGRLEVQSRTTHLAAMLADELLEVVGDGQDSPVVAVLAPVFRFVDANLHLPLTRPELAARAGLAPSRFHQVFLAAIGESPMAWVRRRRLARAAELLAGTTLGMADIAARVGLCDAYHLNKRFRAAYGMPPTRFRQQAQD